jgi:hypothetical protein
LRKEEMSANQQLNASNYIVNIVELQNVITSASGLTPLDVLSNQVQSIATMVNFDLKRININTIAKYDTTPIQVIDDINLSNVNLTQNGSIFVSGGGGSGGGTQISSGATSIILLSNSATQPLISFNIGNSNFLGFTSNYQGIFSGTNFTIQSPATFTLGGNNAASGKSLLCLDSIGNTTWGYISTLRTANTISFQKADGTAVAELNTSGTLGLTGSLGIGLLTPTRALDVVGSAKITGTCDITGNCSAFSFLSVSDKRFKENIETLSNATTLVERMRGVRFTWSATQETDIGVIAQEMREVLPEAVLGEEKLSVAYHKVIPVLLESIKELSQRIKILESHLHP